MGVQPAAADDVAARRVERGRAAARRQRAGQQDGAADLRAERAVQLGFLQAFGAQLDGMAFARHRHAEIGQQLEHVLDVEDARDVVEDDGFVGQDAGGQHRQRGVLVAQRPERAADLPSAPDDEPRHGLPTPP